MSRNVLSRNKDCSSGPVVNSRCNISCNQNVIQITLNKEGLVLVGFNDAFNTIRLYKCPTKGV